MGGGADLIMSGPVCLPGHAASHVPWKPLPRTRESGIEAGMTETVPLLHSFYWLSF